MQLVGIVTENDTILVSMTLYLLIHFILLARGQIVSLKLLEVVVVPVQVIDEPIDQLLRHMHLARPNLLVRLRGLVVVDHLF